MDNLAEFTLVTPTGRHYDIRPHVIDVRSDSSVRAFCAQIEARIVDPGLSYMGEIQYGSTIRMQIALPDSVARIRVVWEIDSTDRSSQPAGGPSVVTLMGRGSEARLIDRELLDVAGTVAHFIDADKEIVDLLMSNEYLADTIEGCDTHHFPDFPCAIGIGRATGFQLLKDVADHFGLGFQFDSDTQKIEWRLPERDGKHTPTSLNLSDMVHVRISQEAPSDIGKPIDAWD